MALAAIASLAAVLLLTNLGNRYLWQDEAQTALLARTILDGGIPLGTDGRNSFSQERGAEFGEDGVWRWHPWLSFYLVAASFATFGENAGAARLPFALLGVASVVLTGCTARRLWRDRTAALAAAGTLALCVPFLLLHRQARWYAAAAFLSLLGLHAYTRIRPGAWGAVATLVGAATLLFHTHYLYATTLLVALILHALLFERPRLRGVLAGAAATGLLNLPWIVWFAGVRYADNYAERLFDPTTSLRYARRYLLLTMRDFLHPLFLGVPVGLAAWFTAFPSKASPPDAETRRGVWLVVLFCAVTLAALALTSPGAYVRYLTPLVPPLFLLVGLAVAATMRLSRILGLALVATWIAVAGHLPLFLHELRHDYDGPIEGIVEFFQEHGQPGDTIAITYGDLPVKFYGDFRVIGGLTGEDLSEARDADWILLRKHAHTEEEKRVRAELLQHLSPGTYKRYEIPAPDLAWGNREDVRLHRFATVQGYDPIVVFGRRR
jgi:4-amino-4-deoxy-L-arabinose transferase-like glycosyltransferase